jgi:hypothetical protein
MRTDVLLLAAHDLKVVRLSTARIASDSAYRYSHLRYGASAGSGPPH